MDAATAKFRLVLVHWRPGLSNETKENCFCSLIPVIVFYCLLLLSKLLFAVYCLVFSVYCLLPTYNVYCLLSITYCPLSLFQCLLSTIAYFYCLFSNGHCVLSSDCYLLSIVYSLLFILYCLLYNVYCFIQSQGDRIPVTNFGNPPPFFGTTCHHDGWHDTRKYLLKNRQQTRYNRH